MIPAGIVCCASSSFCGMGHLSAVCFLQGSWSSFQLKRENFWLGRDGLGLRKNWIIQEYEAFEKKKKKSALVCKKSVSFTECLQLTTNAGIPSIYVSI